MYMLQDSAHPRKIITYIYTHRNWTTHGEEEVLLTHFSNCSRIWPAFYMAKSLGAGPSAFGSSTKPCFATSLDFFQYGLLILWDNPGCLPREPWREEEDVCTWLPLLTRAHSPGPRPRVWLYGGPLSSTSTRGRRACELLKTTGGKEPPWVVAVPTWTCWNLFCTPWS